MPAVPGTALAATGDSAGMPLVQERNSSVDCFFQPSIDRERAAPAKPQTTSLPDRLSTPTTLQARTARTEPGSLSVRKFNGLLSMYPAPFFIESLQYQSLECHTIAHFLSRLSVLRFYKSIAISISIGTGLRQRNYEFDPWCSQIRTRFGHQ